eukprot:1004323-Pelagomonas_calceolata.AAC.1
MADCEKDCWTGCLPPCKVTAWTEMDGPTIHQINIRGFGGQTLRRKPPLLRQPGSHLHTLVVRGSGAYIDGPRLQHLLTLSSYAEGEDRSRAARLLGGLKVLEVEVGQIMEAKQVMEL